MANINTRQNTNSTSNVKSDNGFCILASAIDNSADSYIRNYQALTFDAVTKTSVSRAATVTSYAVETGSEISDHVQIKNRTLSLSGMVTETPVKLNDDMLRSVGNSGGRIKQMITYLNKVLDARNPITLVTSHNAFNTVVLVGIDYTYTAEDAMQFDLKFEEVRQVKTATVNTVAIKTLPTKTKGATVKKKVSSGPAQRKSLNDLAAERTKTPTNTE